VTGGCVVVVGQSTEQTGVDVVVVASWVVVVVGCVVVVGAAVVVTMHDESVGHVPA